MGGKKRELLGGRISCFPFCKYIIKKKKSFVFQEGNTATEAVMGESLCQGILLGPGGVSGLLSFYVGADPYASEVLLLTSL